LVFARELLHNILSSELFCPIGYRQVLAHLKSQLVAKFIDFDPVLIGAYFFLSFICPAIIQPQQVDIMPTQPTPATQTGLIAISKILQNLANGSTFSPHVPFAKEMNEFIEEHTTAMRSFLINLLNEDNISKYKMLLVTTRTGSFGRFLPSSRRRSLALLIINHSENPEYVGIRTFSKEVAAYLEKWKADALAISDFEKTANWKKYLSKGGFNFYSLRSGKNFIARFTGELPCCMSLFEEYLNTWEAKKLDPLYCEGSTVEAIDKFCEVQHIIYKPGFPLKMRDSVFFKYHAVFKDEVVHIWLPVSHSAKPEQKGKLRAAIELVWRVKAIDQSHCTVHMMLNADYVVKLPKWVRRGLLKGTLPSFASRAYEAASQLGQNPNEKLVYPSEDLDTQFEAIYRPANEEEDSVLSDTASETSISVRKDLVLLA